MIKGRKEVFSERLEGKQGLGDDMEDKQMRQQTARRGVGVTKLALFLFWLQHQQLQIKKKKIRKRRGWMEGGMLNGLAQCSRDVSVCQLSALRYITAS